MSSSATLRVAPQWVLPQQTDPDAVSSLCDALQLPEPICRLLLLRGYADMDQAKLFLRPRLQNLHDPNTMLDLDRAVDRLARAISARETVLVHGDYDVDGISSTTILTRTIRGLGGVAVPFIPHRVKDGYDLGEAGVRAAIEAGARVVVTCDCGTTAVKPIAKLCEAGIDVIVTDHHLPGPLLPQCLAILNPRRQGCGYPDKDLAAVGVVFKLALALAQRLQKKDNFIWSMLDLVALATIADIAPLRGENRIMVRYGLRMMEQSYNIGLRAMIRAAGLSGKPITAGRVGYILGPRLNAAGRIGSAMRGVELLLSENEHDANVIARELEELNRNRQDLDRATLQEAREQALLMDLDNTYGLVLWSENWHPGVIGIVASKIVEEFGRPAMLIAVEGDEGKGSGRSISAFDLHAGLNECSDTLVRFGGHKAAAGITIKKDNISSFADCFNQVARSKLNPQDLHPQLRIDLEVPIENATKDLQSFLAHFEPFGMGNPSPTLFARNVRLAGPPRIVGKDGLRLRLATPSGELDAIGWGFASRANEFSSVSSVDIAYKLELDEYKGESKLVAKICDICAS